MSTTELKVYGPYVIPFYTVGTGGSTKHIYPENIKEFWNNIEEQEDYSGFIYKQGCYVFAMRVGGGITPYYVGKTKNKSGFVGEIFTDHKRGHYNDFLSEGIKGTPVMYFIAPKKQGKNIVSKNDLDEIETFLIQHARSKNENLLNTKKARLPEWSIEGVVRRGKGHPGKVIRSFKQMMGL